MKADELPESLRLTNWKVVQIALMALTPPVLALFAAEDWVLFAVLLAVSLLFTASLLRIGHGVGYGESVLDLAEQQEQTAATMDQVSATMADFMEFRERAEREIRKAHAEAEQILRDASSTAERTRAAVLQARAALRAGGAADQEGQDDA